jgi:hypothetical protein
MLGAGCWLLATGCWLLAAGYWLFVGFGSNIQTIKLSNFIVHRFYEFTSSPTGRWLLAAGY